MSFLYFAIFRLNLRTLLLATCLCMTIACGGGDQPPPSDAGSDAQVRSCPASNACCYFVNNSMNLAQPGFRIAALTLTSPATLSGSFVSLQLNGAIDSDRLNWIIAISDADTEGPVTMTMGHGWPTGRGSYRFANGDAPASPVTKWDPVTATGTLTGETFTTDPASSTLTIPVFADSALQDLLLELVLDETHVVSATFSEDRSCIGALSSGGVFDTSAGQLRAFITIANSVNVRVNFGATETTLCNLAAGQLDHGTEPCTSIPQENWSDIGQPTALCGSTGCEANVYDPKTNELVVEVCDTATECNAWEIKAGFAAYGVTVE